MYDVTVVPESTRRTKTQFIFMNENLCATAKNNSQRTALFVVLSARKNFDNRNLIRQTYGSIKSANNVSILATVFMLGNWDDGGVEETDCHRLQAEIDQFGDIVVGDFIDSYRNLTLKTIMAYEWLTSYCREAELVVKTDDDVVVNVFQLTKVLDSWSPADISSLKIWCRVHRYESEVNDTSTAFYPSPLDFPDGKYPDFCSGLGYVTTIGVIDRIVDEISKSFPRRVCTHEDVFMTAIVPKQINSIRNSFRQKPQPVELVDHQEWRSYALENGSGDEDYFLRNLVKQTNNANVIENLNEFRRKYETTIFYLLAHSVDFKKNYLRLWQIIKTSFSN